MTITLMASVEAPLAMSRTHRKRPQQELMGVDKSEVAQYR
jgi:hypothetical protein